MRNITKDYYIPLKRYVSIYPSTNAKSNRISTFTTELTLLGNKYEQMHILLTVNVQTSTYTHIYKMHIHARAHTQKHTRTHSQEHSLCI